LKARSKNAVPYVNAACPHSRDTFAITHSALRSVMRATATLLFTFAFVPQALADAQTECSKWQTTPPERSIVVCTQLLQRQPGLDWAVLNRGWAHYKLRHYDEAIADFTRVLDITPKQTKAFFNRARAYVEKGDNLRAVADYTRILDLDPLSDFALSVRGWVLTKLGHWADARRDAERALAIKPSNPYAHYVRGLVTQEEGRTEQALEDFTRSVALGFVQPMAHIMRAEAYRARGDAALAIECYRATLGAESRGRDDDAAQKLASERLQEMLVEQQSSPVAPPFAPGDTGDGHSEFPRG